MPVRSLLVLSLPAPPRPSSMSPSFHRPLLSPPAKADISCAISTGHIMCYRHLARAKLAFSLGRCYVAPVKKLSIALAIVLLAAVTAHAASLTGTWNAKVDLGGQGGTPTFVLKQYVDKLTGTYAGALGDAPVTGTVKGSDVSFDFEVQGPKVHYAGKLNPDGTQIEGTCDYGGQGSVRSTTTQQPAQ